MEDDRLLFVWLRHYAFLIVLFLVFGLLAGAAYSRLAPKRAEAWSYVIETQPQIPALQLGPVAKAVFTSPVVYGPVMKSLGIRQSTDRFLGNTVELRPIPGTLVLIVIGRSSDLRGAETLSGAMAQALVRALYSQGHLPFFTIFDKPQPAPAGERVSQSLLTAVGGSVGLLLGLAIALFHYRARRPILAPDRAFRMVRADHVTLMRGKGPPWLGVLRGSPAWRDTGRNRRRLARLAQAFAGRRPLRVELPGVPDHQGLQAQRLSSVLGVPLTATMPSDPSEPSGGLTVVICGAWTAEPDLQLSGLTSRNGDEPAGWMELLWLR